MTSFTVSLTEVLASEKRPVENSENIVHKDLEADSEKLSGGTTPEGGVVEHQTVFSRKWFGILANYWGTGWLFQLYNCIVVPVVYYMNNGTQNQIAVAQFIVGFFATFQYCFAIFSDSIRIFGLLKKYWIVGGWLATNFILLMGGIFLPPLPSINTYILFFTFPSAIFLFAQTASDGATMYLASTEPLKLRGKNQSYTLIVRFTANLLLLIFTCFCFNGPAYQGPYSWDVNMKQFTLFLWGITFLIAPLAFFFFAETPETFENAPMKQQFINIWYLLQDKAVFVCILWHILAQFFGAFSFPQQVLQGTWLNFNSQQSQIANMLGYISIVFGNWIYQQFLVNFNWRYQIGVYTVLQVLMTLIPVVLISLNITQNIYFYYIVAAFGSQVVYGFNFLIGSVTIAEVAPKGLEAVTFSIMASAGNLAQTVSGSLLSGQLAVAFDINSPQQLMESCPSVNSTASSCSGAEFVVSKASYNMIYCTLVVSILNLCAIPTTWIIPPQKKETQELRERQERVKWGPHFTLIYFVVVTLWSISYSLLQIFPSTSCLQYVGGNGC